MILLLSSSRGISPTTEQGFGDIILDRVVWRLSVLKACQLFYRTNGKALVERIRGKEGRQVAIYLAKILSGAKGKEIGQHFGIKGPAVSDAIKRIEGRLEKEAQLRERVEFLKGKLLPAF